MSLFERLLARSAILHASSAWGSDEDAALMDAARSRIFSLETALDGLIEYLKDTPHHNATQAAYARAVYRGEAA